MGSGSHISPRVGVWDQVLAFGQYQHATIDGVPVLTVFDASTCAAMLDDFAAHPESDVFYDKQHEIVDDLGDAAMDRDALKKWGDGHAMAWANAMAMIVGGKVVRYEAHANAPPQPPSASSITQQSDGTDRGDGVYALRCEVTPRGADPKDGLPAFRYTSPYFVPDKDGWRLLNMTATNDPRMRGAALAMERNRQVVLHRVAMQDDASGQGDPDDIDTDDDGELDVEHYPLPAELLRAAGIESDEDWDALDGSARATMGRVRFDAKWDESKHDRDNDGKFAPKGGGGGGGGGSSDPPQTKAAPKAKTKAAPKAKSKGWTAAETTPVPNRPDGKPGGRAGAQLHPDVLQKLKSIGINKLPSAHIEQVQINHEALNDPNRVNEEMLLKWKDDRGKWQPAYSAEFDRRNANAKWERVLTNRAKVDEQMDDLRAMAGRSPTHAAALLIALTGLRPGSSAGVKDTGHFGATTMQAQHLSFDEDGAHIQYVGKSGKVNKAHVTDPALVDALKKATEGKGPSDPVFPGVSSPKVADALPKGVKTKDLRTLVATTDAERHLAQAVPPPLVKTGDPKKDAVAEKAQARAVVGILKHVSTLVSKQLNNTPDMARRSYIAPQVIRAWGEKHNIKPEWLGDTPAAQQAARVPMERDMEEENKELMARAGCMESDTPAAQIEKMAAYIRKMEDDAKKKDEENVAAMARMMEPEFGDLAEKMAGMSPAQKQNYMVHLKTGNQHDGKGDGPGYDPRKDPNAPRKSSRMESGDEIAMQAMKRELDAAKSKLAILEPLAGEVKALREAMAMERGKREAAEQVEKTRFAREKAEQAIVMGRLKPDHKGDVSKTLDWLTERYAKDATATDDMLAPEGTFQPSERIAMVRMTEGGRGIGQPMPQVSTAVETWAQKIDAVKAEDPKRTFDAAERIAMQRFPREYQAYINNHTMAKV